MDTTKRINFKYHHANSIIRSKVTSIKQRLDNKGYLDELELAFFLANKGSVPLCCHWEPNEDGKIKCESSEYMTEEDFREYCIACQRDITNRLEVR